MLSKKSIKESISRKYPDPDLMVTLMPLPHQCKDFEVGFLELI